MFQLWNAFISFSLRLQFLFSINKPSFFTIIYSDSLSVLTMRYIDRLGSICWFCDFRRQCIAKFLWRFFLWQISCRTQGLEFKRQLFRSSDVWPCRKREWILMTKLKKHSADHVLTRICSLRLSRLQCGFFLFKSRSLWKCDFFVMQYEQSGKMWRFQ